MPITGPNSYPSTVSQFISHWDSLNTLLVTPVVLTGARSLATLQTWLTSIETAIINTNTAIVTAANRKSELDQIKVNLLNWTVIFNATIRLDHPTLPYIRTLADAPKISSGRGEFSGPLVRTSSIWNDTNDRLAAEFDIIRKTTAANGTIVTETLGKDTYQALILELNSKWDEWVGAMQTADNKREVRNDLQKLIYDTLRDYRAKAPLILPPGHALLDSLPALTPDTARRPAAPVGSGTWNAATSNADLTATPSASAGVVRTELRYSPEDPYNSQNEIALVSIPAGQPLIFSTDLGLGIPGDTSRFTWVALTADGHEGASTVIVVTRT